MSFMQSNVMTFTDDDLKRLKEFGENEFLVESEYQEIHQLLPALLTRLEAAEKFLEGYSDLKDDQTYEAWRKAAGK